MVTEKFCDVLFRLKHSAYSPSVVIHGDNLKHYHGKQMLDFQVPSIQENEIQFPNNTEFAGFRADGTQQHVCSDQSRGNVCLNRENQSFLQGNNTVTDHDALQPVQGQSTQHHILGNCDTRSSNTGTNELNSSVSVSQDHLLQQSISGSSNVNEHSFSNGLQINSHGNFIPQFAEQSDSRPSCASIPEHLAEQSSSNVFTPLAEQPNYTETARTSVSKDLTEQHDNQVQSFQTESYSVPISSQTVRQSRRDSKKKHHI